LYGNKATFIERELQGESAFTVCLSTNYFYILI